MPETPVLFNTKEDIEDVLDKQLQQTLPDIDLELTPNLQAYLKSNGLNSPDIDLEPTAIKPPTSVQNIWDNFGQDLQSVKMDQFKTFKPVTGDFRNYKYINQFYDRYKIRSAYDKLGFDPLRDNEELYNKHTSVWEDFQIAAGSWVALRNLGVIDSMSFGEELSLLGLSSDKNITELSDTENAEKYAKANAIGSSSKGGVTGFATNLFINSGYTIGIGVELLFENLVIGLAEKGLITIAPVTGGASLIPAGILATRLGMQTTRAASKIGAAFKTGSKLVKTLDALKDVNKSKNAFVKALKATGNILNPLDNTLDFIRGVDKMNDVSDIVKTYRGFTSVYKDMRNVRMAFSESALEAGGVENQIYDDLIDEIYNTTGIAPTEEDYKKISVAAKTAATKTALQNMPLIFFSNKITLDALTRGPFKKLYSDTIETGLGRNITFKKSNFKSGKKVFDLTPKDFLNRQWSYFRDPKAIVRNMTTYGMDNVMEGVQELGQEVISGTNIDYYKTKHKGDATKGGYYKYLLSNMDKMVSAYGLETFMSGFLMQKMAGPITQTMGVLTQGKNGMRGTTAGDIGGYVYDKATQLRYLNSPEKYNDYITKQKEIEKIRSERLDKDVNLLNQLYENPLTNITDDLDNLVKQGKLTEVLKAAELAGDKKSFVDFKDSAYFEHVMTVLKYGRTDTFLERLKDFKKIPAKDLIKDGVDPDNYYARLDIAKERLKTVESMWDHVQKKYPNPYDPYKYSDPLLRQQESNRKAAWDDAISEVVFNQYTFKRTLERQTELLSKTKDVAGLTNTPYSDFNLLLDRPSLLKKIQELKSLFDGTTEPLSKELSTLLKEGKTKIEKLEAFEEALSNIEAIKEDSRLSSKEYKTLRKAYTDYINILTKANKDYINNDQVDESLQAIIDYHQLEGRTTNSHKAVNALLDPKGFMNLHAVIEKIYKAGEKEREANIKDSILQFDKLAKTNEIFKTLEDAGMFMDRRNIKQIEHGEPITNLILYNNTPSKGQYSQIARSDPKYKQAIQILNSKYPELKIPILESNVDPKYLLTVQEKDPDDKRTYEDLAKEYGFNPTKDSSIVSVRIVLMKIMDSEYASDIEKALAANLLNVVKDTDHITFLHDHDRPGEFKPESKEQVIIDPRYMSYDHDLIGLPFEFIILNTELQRQFGGLLESDANFKKEIESLRVKAESAFDTLSTSDKKTLLGTNEKNVLKGLTTDLGFIIETMTNAEFRKYLTTIEHDEVTGKVTVWQKFIDLIIDGIKTILKPNGTVLNAALDIITTKIGPDVVVTNEPAKDSKVTTVIPDDINEQNLKKENVQDKSYINKKIIEKENIKKQEAQKFEESLLELLNTATNETELTEIVDKIVVMISNNDNEYINMGTIIPKLTLEGQKLTQSWRIGLDFDKLKIGDRLHTKDNKIVTIIKKTVDSLVVQENENQPYNINEADIKKTINSAYIAPTTQPVEQSKITKEDMETSNESFETNNDADSSEAIVEDTERAKTIDSTKSADDLLNSICK